MVVLCATALLVLATSAAQAQTPITAIGLGYPTPPLDSRGAALGGIGIGLLGGSFTTRNPADLVEFRVPTFSVTGSPQSVTLRGSPGGSVGRNEFPILGFVIPLHSWAFSAQAGSFLDEDWSVSFEDTLSTSGALFPYTDRREHKGGVSTVDFSLARSLGPLSVGVSYGRLVGSLRETFIRQFQASVDSSATAPTTVSDMANWSYSGWSVKVGAGLRLGNRFRLSGAYGWMGDMTARRDSVGTLRSFPMPASVSVGASALPIGDLLLTVGGGWTGWSVADGRVAGSRARNVRWEGAGIEFDGWSLGPFPLSLRGGARYRQLPFWQKGFKPLDEKALTFGLGVYFAGNRAVIDAALEVGRRGSFPQTGIQENYRRFVLTASLRQVPIPGLLF